MISDRMVIGMARLGHFLA